MLLRTTNAIISRLRTAHECATPGKWTLRRTFPGTPSARMSSILTENDRTVLTIAADATNAFRLPDLAFACRAHNHIGEVLDEIACQSVQVQDLYAALAVAVGILQQKRSFLSPTELQALNTLKAGLSHRDTIAAEPPSGEPATTRRRAINIE